MEKITFSFGRNWQKFLKSINDERIRQAETSISEFIELPSLENKTFLDIGCGSGLFSFAAWRLKASQITSFDYDPFSVECGRHMHEKAGKPSNWQISSGSVLDKAFLESLGTFDVVYSWGVLHHTGQMWNAISNAATRVKPGGLFYFTLYNKVEDIVGSEFWVRIKKLYNASPKLGKALLEFLYFLAYFPSEIIKRRNPVRNILTYHEKRGMHWKTDFSDWLGGYPYEFATTEEVFKFMKKNFPSFKLVNLKTTNGLGINWFLYKSCD